MVAKGDNDYGLSETEGSTEAVVVPLYGLTGREGAQVASQQSPILPSGKGHSGGWFREQTLQRGQRHLDMGVLDQVTILLGGLAHG